MLGSFCASLAWHAGLGVLYAVWGRRYAPPMFADSCILNVHGHGWWGWHACCGGLGRVWTVCLCGLPHKSSVRSGTGTTCRCVGGGLGRLLALNPCYLTSTCSVNPCMYNCVNFIAWVGWGGMLTWWWGSFLVRFGCRTGLGVLCVELVLQICTVYVF